MPLIFLLKRKIQGVLFAAFMLLAISMSGCQSVMYTVFGPPPPHPRPVWHSSNSAHGNIQKVAVFVTDRSQFSNYPSIAHTVEDDFIEHLLNKGYRVADRSNVEQVLNEIKFQHSGLTESDVAKLGKMLNVSAVFLITINGASVSRPSYAGLNNNIAVYNLTASLSARLIRVEDSEVLGLTSFGDTYEDNDPNSLRCLSNVTDAVASVLPNPNQ